MPTKTSLVTKHNALIPSLSKMELQELRLLAFCLSHLQPKHERDFYKIEASAQELAKIFGLAPKCAYSVIREVTKKVNSKPIELEEEDGTKRIRWWFAGLDYIPGAGTFEFAFNPLLKDKLLDLATGSFTQFRIKDVYQFKSATTWRIYENLRQWKCAGSVRFNLLEFKVLAGVEGKYSRFGDLNQRVLTPAIKEINAKSDIQVQFESETKGRKVTDLIFFIRDNDSTKTPMEKVRAVATRLDDGQDAAPALARLLRDEYMVSVSQARQLANLAGGSGREAEVTRMLPKIRARFDKLPATSRKTSLGGYVFKALLAELIPQQQRNLPL